MEARLHLETRNDVLRAEAVGDGVTRADVAKDLDLATEDFDSDARAQAVSTTSSNGA